MLTAYNLLEDVYSDLTSIWTDWTEVSNSDKYKEARDKGLLGWCKYHANLFQQELLEERNLSCKLQSVLGPHQRMWRYIQPVYEEAFKNDFVYLDSKHVFFMKLLYHGIVDAVSVLCLVCLEQDIKLDISEFTVITPDVMGDRLQKYGICDKAFFIEHLNRRNAASKQAAGKSRRDYSSIEASYQALIVGVRDLCLKAGKVCRPIATRSRYQWCASKVELAYIASKIFDPDDRQGGWKLLFSMINAPENSKESTIKKYCSDIIGGRKELPTNAKELDDIIDMAIAQRHQ